MTLRLVNRRRGSGHGGVSEDGRAALVAADGSLLDLERTSQGRFGPDPMEAIRRWAELRSVSAEWIDAGGGEIVPAAELGPCVPRPSKVFAVGLNYRDHARETGREPPPHPMVFTKFPSCLAGPDTTVELRGDTVDWEVELVAVIGLGGRDLALEDALNHVAGYTVGQDLSDRTVQVRGDQPQFSLGKSFDGYGPIGPALVDARDGIDDRPASGAGRSIWCELNGERVQQSSTDELLFDVATLIRDLSAVCTLEPGDLIFTGTPSGVGVGRQPPRFLAPGDELVSGIDGLGRLTTRFR